MFQILQSVQVTNPDHERHQQAGAVWMIDQAAPDSVNVRFDVDSEVVAVDVADLKAL